jgi:hypothetical protein
MFVKKTPEVAGRGISGDIDIPFTAPSVVGRSCPVEGSMGCGWDEPA